MRHDDGTVVAEASGSFIAETWTEAISEED